MVALRAVLLFVSLCSVISAEQETPYVQARQSLYRASLLLEENLPDKYANVHNLEDRPCLSLALIGGLTGELVASLNKGTKYEPLLLIQKRLPYYWREYRPTAAKIRAKLAEAKFDVRVISELINDLCGSSDVKKCNALIKKQVDEDPNTYKLPAQLLLQLGRTSDSLLQLQPNVLDVIKGNDEIPYYMANSKSNMYMTLLYSLRNSQDLMDLMSARRRG